MGSSPSGRWTGIELSVQLRLSYTFTCRKFQIFRDRRPRSRKRCHFNWIIQVNVKVDDMMMIWMSDGRYMWTQVLMVHRV